MASARHIILIHGLARSRFDMFLLAPRLRTMIPHSTIHIFEYRSRSLSLPHITDRLRDFVHDRTQGESVSFVGHSLGGIVARALDAEGTCSAPLHRLVTLGSPHNGASIARFLARYRGPRAIFGPILHELGSLSLPPTPRQLSIGCIIGQTGNRFGFLPLFGEDNDGIVTSREARLESCTAHTSVLLLHAALPFSKRVASLSARFLIDGAF